MQALAEAAERMDTGRLWRVETRWAGRRVLSLVSQEWGTPQFHCFALPPGIERDMRLLGTVEIVEEMCVVVYTSTGHRIKVPDHHLVVVTGDDGEKEYFGTAHFAQQMRDEGRLGFVANPITTVAEELVL